MKNSNKPFEFVDKDVKSNSGRQIRFTPQLVSLSNSRAIELIRAVNEDPALHDLTNRVLDEGQTQDTIDLIEKVFDEKVIQEDAKILADATETELSRLLESRRSDRSKAKKKNPRKSVTACTTFIGSMYAEILVRLAWDKPYQQQSNELDFELYENDLDALNKKIDSLRSKQSRLRKSAPFVEEDQKALEQVQDDIARLVALRPGEPRVTAKSIIKSAELEDIRKALELVDTKNLSKDQQDRLEELIQKLA